MATLTAVEFLSLDGVMQGLASPDEDTDNEFPYGGWGIRFAAAVAEAGPGHLDETTGYLFGRRTYQRMVAFWPSQGDNSPIAASLNSRPKYVVSSTLQDPDWTPTTVLSGEPAPEVSALKDQAEGRITILGSGLLVHELMQHDLIDELQLFVHPLLLGTGKRLFRSLPRPRDLTLNHVSSTSLGSVVLNYSLGQESGVQ